MFHLNKPFKKGLNKVYKNADTDQGSRRSRLLAEARQTRANRDAASSAPLRVSEQPNAPSRRRSMENVSVKSGGNNAGRRNSAPAVKSWKGSNRSLLARQPSPDSIILLTPDPSGDKMEIDGTDESLPKCLRQSSSSRRSLGSTNTSADRRSSMSSHSSMQDLTSVSSIHHRRSSAPHTNNRQKRTVDFSTRYSRQIYA